MFPFVMIDTVSSNLCGDDVHFYSVRSNDIGAMAAELTPSLSLCLSATFLIHYLSLLLTSFYPLIFYNTISRTGAGNS